MLRGWACLIAALLLPLTGCQQRPPVSQEASQSPAVRTFYVLRGDRQVLKIKDEPGPLISGALLPPGQKPAQHPFLTAFTLDPMEEDSLRQVLEKSKSFVDFVSNLKAAGYTVVPADEGF